MDIYQIIGYIIVLVGGRYFYNYLNKRTALTWSKIIYLYIGGLILMLLGGAISQFVMYVGIIIFFLGGFLMFGKMFRNS